MYSNSQNSLYITIYKGNNNDVLRLIIELA